MGAYIVNEVMQIIFDISIHPHVKLTRVKIKRINSCLSIFNFYVCFCVISQEILVFSKLHTLSAIVVNV